MIDERSSRTACQTEGLCVWSLPLLLHPREFHFLSCNLSLWIFMGLCIIFNSVLKLGHTRHELVSMCLG